MIRKLPIVAVEEEEGRHFFFDERLHELRAVDNPYDFIDLSVLEVLWYRDPENQVIPAKEF